METKKPGLKIRDIRGNLVPEIVLRADNQNRGIVRIGLLEFPQGNDPSHNEEYRKEIAPAPGGLFEFP